MPSQDTRLSTDPILDRLRSWAIAQDNVRGLLLTSSRANPLRTVDVLSDYDVEVFVRDTEPFETDDRWLRVFGTPLVRWPYHPRSTFDSHWITRLVLFEEGHRIDFQIADLHQKSWNLDAGFRILVDKDGFLETLDEADPSRYWVEKPDGEEFEVFVHEFWWNASSVPKALWRNELPYAEYIMSHSIRGHYLNGILAWRIGMEHRWAVNLGVSNRWLQRFLIPEDWTRYQATFADADLTRQWKAFFAAVDLFSDSGGLLGQALGFSYPVEVDRKMKALFRSIRAMPRSQEP